MSQPLKAFLRLKQVVLATGMSRSWIYAAMARGDFPASVAVGPRAVVWDAESVAEWQSARIQQVGQASARSSVGGGEDA
jgi:prophage regulatory protein